MKSPQRWIRLLCILILAVLIVILMLLREELFCVKENKSQDEAASNEPNALSTIAVGEHSYRGTPYGYELSLEQVESFPTGYSYSDILWLDITPTEWAGNTDWSLLKHETTGITCLVDSQKQLWPITQVQLDTGVQLTGYGLTDVLLTDCDKDGRYELIVSCSFDLETGCRSAVLLIDMDEAGSSATWPMLNFSADNMVLLLEATEQGSYIASEAQISFAGEGMSDWTLTKTDGLRKEFIYQDGQLFVNDN